MPVTTRSKSSKSSKSSKRTAIKKTKSVKSNKKTQQLSLKNLYIKEYKKGLKIETDTKSALWGEPYVQLGNKWMYWNDNMKCWFCSTSCEDELLKQGAKWFSQKSKSKKSTKSVPNQLFIDMTIETYGKGYLLIPKKNNVNWGEKYYNNGWWMKSKKAWFFKSNYHNFLMVNGATEIGDSDSDILDYSDEYNELDKSLFKGTILENYKNGLILKPKKSHPDWGEKYYHNGFWNVSLKSWVFKTDAKNFLVTHGAKLSH